jgi:hypothetical protein
LVASLLKLPDLLLCRFLHDVCSFPS